MRHDLARCSDTIKALEREASDSNYRHGKIVADLERDLREKYSKLDDFVKTTDQETARLRKDRDTMRQMYEQSNSLLSGAQKQISIYESKLSSNDSAIKSLNEVISTLKSQIAEVRFAKVMFCRNRTYTSNHLDIKITCRYTSWCSSFLGYFKS